ncbi:hypothetical protein H5410_046314 [Solanum commersonii]|uniref:Uncharacterized protein n=1 Tax=Solanum commersonii TaxID=4109 RepID=A0A9J5XG52_SOLCO|nr:hypothetical protein H5410_046314 [Solanum commersonii]
MVVKSACLSRTYTLRWMCSHTKSDMIWNKAIQDDVGVTSMIDKMREARLRWFEHVKKRCGEAPVTNGGIFRHKQHLVDTYKDVSRCEKCLDGVREEIKNMLMKNGSKNIGLDFNGM